MNLGGVIHLNKTGVCLVCGSLVILFIYVATNYNYSQKVLAAEAQSPHAIDLRKLLAVAIKAAENGGVQVELVKDNLKIKTKGLTKEGLNDTVTTADFLSHCSMMKTLKHVYPKLNVISEEAKTKCADFQEVDFDDRKDLTKNLSDFWVNPEDVTVWIDPLDATQEYTEKLYDFVTTMVCVAVKGVPVIGVIHKPFSKNTYWAWVGQAKSPNLVSEERKDGKIKITVSRSHAGEIKKVLNRSFQKYDLVTAAGAGYKSVEVATGQVDAYLHITAIKKWDICAGNAIISAMGGKMTTKLNENIDYKDAKSFKNEDGLIATLEYHDSFVGKI